MGLLTSQGVLFACRAGKIKSIVVPTGKMVNGSQTIEFEKVGILG